MRRLLGASVLVLALLGLQPASADPITELRLALDRMTARVQDLREEVDERDRMIDEVQRDLHVEKVAGLKLAIGNTGLAARAAVLGVELARLRAKKSDIRVPEPRGDPVLRAQIAALTEQLRVVTAELEKVRRDASFVVVMVRILTRQLGHHLAAHCVVRAGSEAFIAPLVGERKRVRSPLWFTGTQSEYLGVLKLRPGKASVMLTVEAHGETRIGGSAHGSRSFLIPSDGSVSVARISWSGKSAFGLDGASVELGR